MPIRQLTDRALTRLATDLRVAHMRAEQANELFNERTADLNAKMDEQPNVYHDWMVRRTFLIQDVKRRDTLDDFNFWKGEVARLSAMIQAEYALRELGVAINE